MPRSRFNLVGGGESIALAPGAWVVGRTADAAVQVGDKSVSRRHAMLRVTRDWAEALDLGSQNGTFVNGERVQGGARRLAPGDRIQFGVIEFRFEESPPEESAGEDEAPASETQPISATEVMARARRDLVEEIGERTVVAGLKRPAPEEETATIELQLVRIVLAVADRTWAEQIQRAAEVSRDLCVEILSPAQVRVAARQPGPGALLIDLAAADGVADAISSWRSEDADGTRVVLVAADLPDAAGRAEAARVGAQTFVRTGKPAILVVAAIRFNLELETGAASSDRPEPPEASD